MYSRYFTERHMAANFHIMAQQAEGNPGGFSHIQMSPKWAARMLHQ